MILCSSGNITENYFEASRDLDVTLTEVFVSSAFHVHRRGVHLVKMLHGPRGYIEKSRHQTGNGLFYLTRQLGGLWIIYG